MRETVLKYEAQEIPQIDPHEAEKRAIYGWKLDNTRGIHIGDLIRHVVYAALG